MKNKEQRDMPDAEECLRQVSQGICDAHDEGKDWPETREYQVVLDAIRHNPEQDRVMELMRKALEEAKTWDTGGTVGHKRRQYLYWQALAEHAKLGGDDDLR